jgi:hypothetical protein
VQIGYTAGSRKKPLLGWARNIQRKLPRGAMADVTYRSSSAFALVWNALKMQLPNEIIADFDNYLTTSGIYRMDPLGKKKKGKVKGAYTILDDGENPIVFHDVELAPPSGFFGTNYTRYV